MEKKDYKLSFDYLSRHIIIPLNAKNNCLYNFDQSDT